MNTDNPASPIVLPPSRTAASILNSRLKKIYIFCLRDHMPAENIATITIALEKEYNIVPVDLTVDEKSDRESTQREFDLKNQISQGRAAALSVVFIPASSSIASMGEEFMLLNSLMNGYGASVLALTDSPAIFRVFQGWRQKELWPKFNYALYSNFSEVSSKIKERLPRYARDP